jgi:shikimate kinase
MQMITKPLFEVGFMGAGKSTIGKLVAGSLDVPFYDTDERIEVAAGRSIPAIFAGEGGEPEFRELERDALLAILGEEPGIVSTGGGMVSTQLGRDALRGCGSPVVWLKLDFATTRARVESDIATVRPLFEDPEKALGLFAMRQPWYSEVATAVVDASQPIGAVVNDVAAHIRYE